MGARAAGSPGRELNTKQRRHAILKSEWYETLAIVSNSRSVEQSCVRFISKWVCFLTLNIHIQLPTRIRTFTFPLADDTFSL
jgi:hypothetical protein